MINIDQITWAYDVVLPSGVTASYWMLGNLSLIVRDAKGMLSFYGYLNKEAFDAGKEMLVECQTQVDFSNTPGIDNILAMFVAAAQSSQLPPVATAEPVVDNLE